MKRANGQAVQELGRSASLRALVYSISAILCFILANGMATVLPEDIWLGATLGGLHQLEFDSSGKIQAGPQCDGGPPGTLLALTGHGFSSAPGSLTLNVVDLVVELLVVSDSVAIMTVPLLPPERYSGALYLGDRYLGTVELAVDGLDLQRRLGVEQITDLLDLLAICPGCSSNEIEHLLVLKERLLRAVLGANTEELAIIEAMLANTDILNWAALPSSQTLALFLCSPSPVCQGRMGLVSGFAHPCDDHDPCTTEQCVSEECHHTPIEGCCRYNSDCDDANLCTEDTCEANECVHTPIEGCCRWDTMCDDGNICTEDTCEANECVYTPIEGCCRWDTMCDDGNICTEDTCEANECVHTPIEGCCRWDTMCDDENICTEDTCEANECVHTPIEGCCRWDTMCDDENICTEDTCEANECVYTPIEGCCRYDSDCLPGHMCQENVCVPE